MYLSIIIPVFNESKKIAGDIQAAAKFLTENSYSGEIIVVDDGSDDNTHTTAQNVAVPRQVKLNVIRYEPNRGKGYAVRKGMNISKGKYVMFADCGNCIPYSNTLPAIKLLDNNDCDMAHGSRRLVESDIIRDQPWQRRATSKLFKFIIRILLKVPAELSDTQCGFKVYKGDVARELYGECFSDGFLFDIEMILRAQKKGYRIKEFPVEWTCDPDSRLSLIQMPWSVMKEISRLKRKLTKEQNKSSGK